MSGNLMGPIFGKVQRDLTTRGSGLKRSEYLLTQNPENTNSRVYCGTLTGVDALRNLVLLDAR
jgi:hypothetical protein